MRRVRLSKVKRDFPNKVQCSRNDGSGHWICDGQPRRSHVWGRSVQWLQRPLAILRNAIGLVPVMGPRERTQQCPERVTWW